jgi:transcription initiation factor TFIIIB Brf1 subunit/transcription initiation factor TFIIB
MQGKVEEIAHKILAAAKELKLTSGRGQQALPQLQATLLLF